MNVSTYNRGEQRRPTDGKDGNPVRFPLTPLIPLAQNVQPTGQPTCELTHAVRRSSSGIITVSALAPFGQLRSSFCVPSLLD